MLKVVVSVFVFFFYFTLNMLQITKFVGIFLQICQNSLHLMHVYVYCHWCAGLSLTALLSFVRIMFILFFQLSFQMQLSCFCWGSRRLFFSPYPCPCLDVSMVSLFMAFSHNDYIIFWPFTYSSSGKSNCWSKAEKDKCIYKEPHIVFYLLFIFCHHRHFPKITYFSERLMGGIAGVFITHAVFSHCSDALQAEELVTVLYLLKKHNFVNLFANSYWTYSIIFSGGYNWSHSFYS